MLNEPYHYISTGDYSKCEMYNLDYNKYSYDELANWNRSEMVGGNDTSVVQCSSWMFDSSVTSVVSKVMTIRIDLSKCYSTSHEKTAI